MKKADESEWNEKDIHDSLHAIDKSTIYSRVMFVKAATVLTTDKEAKCEIKTLSSVGVTHKTHLTEMLSDVPFGETVSFNITGSRSRQGGALVGLVVYNLLF